LNVNGSIYASGYLYSYISGTSDNTSYFEGQGAYLRLKGRADYTKIYFDGNAANRWSIGIEGGTDLLFKQADSSNKLTITAAGAATFSSSVTATAFYESSDKTIKTLLVDNYQANGIENITAKLYVKNGKQELGYFAQDVQGILPSAVSVGSDGLLSLSYREVLIAKVQNTETEVDKLKKRVVELESQLNLR